jgi:hypothetical protein
MERQPSAQLGQWGARTPQYQPLGQLNSGVGSAHPYHILHRHSLPQTSGLGHVPAVMSSTIQVRFLRNLIRAPHYFVSSPLLWPMAWGAESSGKPIESHITEVTNSVYPAFVKNLYGAAVSSITSIGGCGWGGRLADPKLLSNNGRGFSPMFETQKAQLFEL